MSQNSMTEEDLKRTLSERTHVLVATYKLLQDVAAKTGRPHPSLNFWDSVELTIRSMKMTEAYSREWPRCSDGTPFHSIQDMLDSVNKGVVSGRHLLNLACANVFFPRFGELPTEIRQLIYSKMLLRDRLKLAHVSQDALDYFKRYPVKVENVFLYVATRRKKAYMHMNVDKMFEARVRLRRGIAETMSEELEDVRKCHCKTNDLYRWPIKTDCKEFDRYRERADDSCDDLLRILDILEIGTLHIRTVLYGGLLEQFQPRGIMRKRAVLKIYCYGWPKWRPNLKLSTWMRWMDFSRALDISILAIDKTYILNPELLSFPQVCNASKVTMYGSLLALDVEQLLCLKTHNLSLYATELREEDLKTYFAFKAVQWLENPSIPLHLHISTPRCRTTYQNGCNCVVEIVRALFLDGLTYDENDFRTEFEEYAHLFVVHSLKHKTTLRVTKDGVSMVPEIDDEDMNV